MICILWAYSTFNPPSLRANLLRRGVGQLCGGMLMGEVGQPPEATRMTNMSNVDLTYLFPLNWVMANLQFGFRCYFDVIFILIFVW